MKDGQFNQRLKAFVAFGDEHFSYKFTKIFVVNNPNGTMIRILCKFTTLCFKNTALKFIS